MNLGIEGKYALVTGGSHGIGLAVVEALREEGCEVASISRREGYDVLRPDDMDKALGEFSDVFVKGQKVMPRKLFEDGFIFEFPEINDAFAHLLN